MAHKKAYAGFLFLTVFSFAGHLFGAERGSQTAVSIEPFYEFVSTDTDNKMLAFGCFKNGFALEDNTTSCTFESIFPVGTKMLLNGGTLYLGVDLIMSNPCTYTMGGTITSDNCIVEMPASLDVLGCTTHDTVFDATNVSIRDDVAVDGTVKFSGASCLCNGNSKTLTLNANGALIAASGTTLTLKDITISGLDANNLRCADDTASIVLDNVRLVQSNNYSFTTGAFEVVGKCELAGTHTFSYETAMTSTVRVESRLTLDDGMTFSYDPSSAAQNLFELTGETSVLELHGATVYTATSSMALSKGKLHVTDLSFFSSAVPTKGIIFGNENAADDLVCALGAGADLHVTSGSLIYKNIRPELCTVERGASTIYLHTGASLRLYQTLNMGDGLMIFEDRSFLRRASGKTLLGSVAIRGDLFYRTLWV